MCLNFQNWVKFGFCNEVNFCRDGWIFCHQIILQIIEFYSQLQLTSFSLGIIVIQGWVKTHRRSCELHTKTAWLCRDVAIWEWQYPKEGPGNIFHRFWGTRCLANNLLECVEWHSWVTFGTGWSRLTTNWVVFGMWFGLSHIVPVRTPDLPN